MAQDISFTISAMDSYNREALFLGLHQSKGKVGFVIDHGSACPAFDWDDLPDEVKSELKQLDRAECNLNFILAGILLRYKLFHVQRAMLLDSTLSPETFDEACYPDTFQMQVVSSILVLYALFGYYQLSDEALQQAVTAGGDGCSANLEVTLSGIVILVALIRFVQLFKSAPEENEPEEPPSEQALAEEEVDFPLD